jgi:hypothetical protein
MNTFYKLFKEYRCFKKLIWDVNSNNSLGATKVT